MKISVTIYIILDFLNQWKGALMDNHHSETKPKDPEEQMLTVGWRFICKKSFSKIFTFYFHRILQSLPDFTPRVQKFWIYVWNIQSSWPDQAVLVKLSSEVLWLSYMFELCNFLNPFLQVNACWTDTWTDSYFKIFRPAQF